MEVKPGMRLRSAVCSTEVIVVRAPEQAVDISCGGVLLVPAEGGGPPPALAQAAVAGGGTLLGKRYTDGETGLEVLCTKAGEGTLAIDGRPLSLKGAKPLPSSD